ncbi:MAG: hypothetical protein ACI81R_002886 [Bradymonadia bacterium]|jgi:hypothetical protein
MRVSVVVLLLVCLANCNPRLRSGEGGAGVDVPSLDVRPEETSDPLDAQTHVPKSDGDVGVARDIIAAVDESDLEPNSDGGQVDVLTDDVESEDVSAEDADGEDVSAED